MKLILTGSTGLVGSRFVELLGNSYEIEEINSSTGTDILDKNSLESKISNSDADVIVHLAAKTNVDACEEDKLKDQELLKLSKQEQETAFSTQKTAWAINVQGTQNIVDVASLSGKKIVYISTDFVFDGKKRSYDELETPNPINWYAKTKHEGEKIVQNSDLKFLILRIAYPYRASFTKSDFARSILNKLQKHEKINVVSDHIFCPTFIDDFVNALDVLIQKNESGIFHCVGSQSLTPYDSAIKIARAFDLDDSVIGKTTRGEYFKGKAQRPFCLDLKNDKISLLGIEMSSFDKGITEIKNQIELI